MKLYLANSSTQAIGGGWSFIANLRKGMGDLVTESYEDADVYFIPSASMVQRDEVIKAQQDGKKIVLRIDNVLRNSRNRNTGMTRMKDFAEWADLVIYQSKWAQMVLGQYLNVKGKVILNSVDTSIFNSKDRSESRTARYLYSRFNRDETKNWEIARFIFQQRSAENSNSHLRIVGQFSPELIEGHFDFYARELFEFLGVVDNPERMADIYKETDVLIYTYFNDACSNTLIEALCSGCKIDDPFGMRLTGGSPEIIEKFDKQGAKFFGLERMAHQYEKEIKEIV